MFCNAGAMGIWGWTMMIAVWGGLAALILWMVGPNRARRQDPAPAALAILDQRFAAGDIDRDEFEERRRTLLGSP